MKYSLVIVLALALLAGCQSQPAYADNGNPGQIKAVVFYDDNKNGVMDSGESGALQRVAITQEVTCTTTGTPNFVQTDVNGVMLFRDLKPGMYCVFIGNGYGMTTKMSYQVYVSSDLVTTVMFGIIRE